MNSCALPIVLQFTRFLFSCRHSLLPVTLQRGAFFMLACMRHTSVSVGVVVVMQKICHFCRWARKEERQSWTRRVSLKGAYLYICTECNSESLRYQSNYRAPAQSYTYLRMGLLHLSCSARSRALLSQPDPSKQKIRIGKLECIRRRQMRVSIILCI